MKINTRQRPDSFSKENNWGGLLDKLFNEVEGLKLKVNGFYSEDTPEIKQPNLDLASPKVKFKRTSKA